jgi:hypothetical protein
MHIALHVCEPPAVPQLWVELAEHTPCPEHADHGDHAPVLISHVRVCVPQLPHPCDAMPTHI